MRHPAIKGFILLTAGLVTPVVLAAPHYVTDRIVANVYALPSEAARVVATLPSGTPVEVLETHGYFSRIHIPNGQQGWIPSPLLNETEPAEKLLSGFADRLMQAWEAAHEPVEPVPGVPAWRVVWFVTLAGSFGFVVGALWLDWRSRTRIELDAVSE